MKSSSIYFDRFFSLSWRFFDWIELIFLAFLLGCVGLFAEKINIFFGPKFPQYSNIWADFWQAGEKLIGYSKELVIIFLVAYFVIFLVAKISGVRIIRSNRLSANLRQMLITTVDRIPSTDQNKRDRAKNNSAERANKAVKKSFVLVKKGSILAVVKIPKQIETRKLLVDYLDDVANDLSGQTGMTSSAWQTVSDGLTFSNYRVMEFRK